MWNLYITNGLHKICTEILQSSPSVLKRGNGKSSFKNPNSHEALVLGEGAWNHLVWKIKGREALLGLTDRNGVESEASQGQTLKAVPVLIRHYYKQVKEITYGWNLFTIKKKKKALLTLGTEWFFALRDCPIHCRCLAVTLASIHKMPVTLLVQCDN